MITFQIKQSSCRELLNTEIIGRRASRHTQSRPRQARINRACRLARALLAPVLGTPSLAFKAPRVASRPASP